MSESGKVSLPTPERIEEIKREAQEESETIYGNCSANITNIELLWLLAALEEAEKEKDKAIDLLGDNLDDKAALILRHGKEITELRDRLYEVNQDAETEQKLNDTLHETNKELRKKLVEAQQTIALLKERERSTIYEVSEIHKEAAAGNSGSLDRADTALNRIMLLSSNLLALGNKEGSDKA